MHPTHTQPSVAVIAALFLVIAGFSEAVVAQIIDFETLPGGQIPTDGMTISNQSCWVSPRKIGAPGGFSRFLRG